MQRTGEFSMVFSWWFCFPEVDQFTVIVTYDQKV